MFPVFPIIILFLFYLIIRPICQGRREAAAVTMENIAKFWLFGSKICFYQLEGRALTPYFVFYLSFSEKGLLIVMAKYVIVIEFKYSFGLYRHRAFVKCQMEACSS